MAADGKSKAPARSSKEVSSPFELMNKYRIPILVVVVVGLFGFGVWGVIVDYLNPQGGADLDKPAATWVFGGKTYEITRREYWQHAPTRGSDDLEVQSSRAFGSIIRKRLADLSGTHVSDAELKGAYQSSVIEPIQQQAGDAYNRNVLMDTLRRAYGMTPAQFETLFREDLTMAKFMTTVDRGLNDASTAEIYEEYRKYYSKLKYKGIFFSEDDYKDAAKLAVHTVGESEELTQESREKLAAWWKELDELRRRSYHKGGALLTVEGIGFRFKDKDDETLDLEFTRQSALSNTSLEALTADYTPTEDELNKMKTRLTHFRDAYGLKPEDDVEAAFEARKKRLTTEWKIWKLAKALHAHISDELSKGAMVDFNALAQANNLQAFKWTNIKLDAMVRHEEYPGFYANQLPGMEPNRLLTFMTSIGPQSIGFDVGPVDEVGKHVSIFRLLDKNLTPEPILADVLKEAAQGYEKDQAKKLLDAAVDSFKTAMDEVMSAKAADFIATVNAETDAAIVAETAGLDADADAKRIDQISVAKKAEAETRIAEEKNKYRGEAFDVAVASPPAGALVIEEGYLRYAPEPQPDREKSDFAAKARWMLRTQFSALRDNADSELIVPVGTVSDPVESPIFTGVKGIAKLVDKKEPSVEDMFFRTNEMEVVESKLRQRRMGRSANAPPESAWSYANLKKAFRLESAWMDDLMAKEAERKRDAEQKAAAYNAQQAARAAALGNTGGEPPR